LTSDSTERGGAAIRDRLNGRGEDDADSDTQKKKVGGKEIGNGIKLTAHTISIGRRRKSFVGRKSEGKGRTHLKTLGVRKGVVPYSRESKVLVL